MTSVHNRSGLPTTPHSDAPPSSSDDHDAQDTADSLLWIASAALAIAMANAILRPDPTPAVALIAIYAADQKSNTAATATLFYTPITILVDAMWLLYYSALQPLTWEQLEEMTRKEQLAVALTAVNVAYKLIILLLAYKLKTILSKHNLAIHRATQGGLVITTTDDQLPTSSSGRLIPQESLAFQDFSTHTSSVL